MNRQGQVNITGRERAGRSLAGLLGLTATVVLPGSSPVVVSAALEVLLITADLDLLPTAATRHCPLYAKLGHVRPTAGEVGVTGAAARPARSRRY